MKARAGITIETSKFGYGFTLIELLVVIAIIAILAAAGNSLAKVASATVILLDALNTSFQDQAYAKAQLIKFLQKVQPEDRVAIYLLTRRLIILQDFTSDPDHLLKALARYRASSSAVLDSAEPAPPDPTGNNDLDQFLQGALQMESDYFNVRRVEDTLQAMEVIAGSSTIFPAFRLWYIESAPSVSTPNTRVPGE